MELGNPQEAKAELARVSPTFAEHPGTLEVAWAIYAAEKNWSEALKAAECLVRSAAEQSSGWLHRAYALRRAPGGGLQAAWDALLPAYEKFPEEPTIPYNLACYACQLHHLDSARRWLQCAVRIGGKNHIKRMAVADPDLEPLWGEIKLL